MSGNSIPEACWPCVGGPSQPLEEPGGEELGRLVTAAAPLRRCATALCGDRINRIKSSGRCLLRCHCITFPLPLSERRGMDIGGGWAYEGGRQKDHESMVSKNTRDILR